MHARRAEVGDIEEAWAFYGRLFEFTLRGMAFQHPDSMGLADLAKYERLHLTTSDSFDETYPRAQLDAHEDAVVLFRGYAQSGPSQAESVCTEDTAAAVADALQRLQ